MSTPSSASTPARRHDIDALRVLAFALVILYHVAMYYVADWHWHLKSPHAAEWLQAPMRALNLWRMDLVFLVSGLAFGLVRRGQTVPGLIRLRSLRLLLPLAFGMAVVVPYQAYAQGVANGLVAPGFSAFLLRYHPGSHWPAGAFDGWEVGMTWNHLWYLAYLWAYTLVLALLLPLAESAPGRRLRAAFTGLRGGALLVLPVLPLALYSVLLWPHSPPTHDLIHDGWLHAVYFTVFVYGYWIGLDAGLWAELVRLRWRTLGLALGLLVLYLTLLALAQQHGMRWARLPLRVLADGYLWTALLAILGWAHHRLNRPWRWLPWANASVYPWYVLHQTVIIVLVVWLAPARLGPVVEPVVLVVGTVALCGGMTAGVQRVGGLRPLFGLARTMRA
ncbi:acyltransferase family protein [Acidovorax sp. NB1]|uniref:acyltransferase family protein n=1 Tax=Acidovorax sp. NB1 TaxID=1943571 RepID=UPI0010EBC71D|nr:acyltransferase family protein [Acidovorax sp. NB1]GDY36383.1 membrane protein [Acidovorax sp. NB1]